MKSSLNHVIGNRLLSAWQPAPSIVWVQSRDPKHSERLRRRSDSTLVAYGVQGGYLRTFEFQGKTLAWADRLLKRYTQNVPCTGTPIKSPQLPN